LCQLYQRRGVITRYGKHDSAWRETADIASIRIWLVILFQDLQDAL